MYQYMLLAVINENNFLTISFFAFVIIISLVEQSCFQFLWLLVRLNMFHACSHLYFLFCFILIWALE